MIPTLVISVSIDQSLAVVWLPDQTSRHHLTSPVRKLLYIVLHSKSFMDQTHLVRINGYWQSFFLFWMMLETLRSKLPQTSHCGLRLDFSHLLAGRQQNQIGVNWSKQKSSHQCVGNCKNYANSAKKIIFSSLGSFPKQPSIMKHLQLLTCGSGHVTSCGSPFVGNSVLEVFIHGFYCISVHKRTILTSCLVKNLYVWTV